MSTFSNTVILRARCHEKEIVKWELAVVYVIQSTVTQDRRPLSGITAAKTLKIAAYLSLNPRQTWLAWTSCTYPLYSQRRALSALSSASELRLTNKWSPFNTDGRFSISPGTCPSNTPTFLPIHFPRDPGSTDSLLVLVLQQINGTVVYWPDVTNQQCQSNEKTLTQNLVTVNEKTKHKNKLAPYRTDDRLFTTDVSSKFKVTVAL